MLCCVQDDKAVWGPPLQEWTPRYGGRQVKSGWHCLLLEWWEFLGNKTPRFWPKEYCDMTSLWHLSNYPPNPSSTHTYKRLVWDWTLLPAGKLPSSDHPFYALCPNTLTKHHFLGFWHKSFSDVLMFTFRSLYHSLDTSITQTLVLKPLTSPRMFVYRTNLPLGQLAPHILSWGSIYWWWQAHTERWSLRS